MKGRKFEAMIREYLLPRMPGFAARKGILFTQPLEYLLRGYCFESSGFDPNGFYCNVFVQPLFVPKRAVVFSIGDRIRTNPGGANEFWSLEDAPEAEIMNDVDAKLGSQGPPFLKTFRDLGDLMKKAVDRKTARDPYRLEMTAYAAILLGNTLKATEMFNRFERSLADSEDRRDWEDELLERGRMVRRTFEQNPAEAVSILHQWRLETARNLKLEEFLAPILAV